MTARRSVPRGKVTYAEGWRDGVEACKRVVEGFLQRGRRVPVRERQEAAPAILGALERLDVPEGKS
jgi:hypothetical protein